MLFYNILTFHRQKIFLINKSIYIIITTKYVYSQEKHIINYI